MKKILLFLLLAAQIVFAQKPTAKLSIIPQPVSVQIGTGQFHLTNKTVILATDAEDKATAQYFNEYLKQVYGFTLPVSSNQKTNIIRLSTKKFIKAPDKDAYSLTVSKDEILIDGDTYNGTFYGIQTLIQLFPTTNYKLPTTNFAIPFVTITDYPRFAYRGMHLDVCRHFFPASFVKKYIDYLALHKMNYFHWHLTEDQGWRIEIKKYPELTTKAGYRNGTIIGRYPGTGNDNIRYGGYYTQNEVKEIVSYAASRHITVIPEIEMPGHSSAAIAAYPWLSCFPHKETVIPSHPSPTSTLLQARGEKKLVQETWGVFDDVYCAGNDSTFAFLQDVLDEVMPLFPSSYVHVGGDECPKTNWKKCPKCQRRIASLGLKDEHGLQSYFIQRIEKYVNGKGKTIIGWDEILEGGLAPNATVMSWQGEKGGIEAAKQKHTVIMTPQKPLYFDHSQTKNEDSLVIGGYNPIEQVYAYEPVPKELTADDAKYILGAQANLWTEYITNPAKVEYMVFPRMSALSEVLWSPKEARDWKDFERRLPVQFQRYEMWKANYSQAYYDITATILKSDKDGTVKVELGSNSKQRLVFLQKKSSLVATPYRVPIYVSKENPELLVVLYDTLKKNDKEFTILKEYRQKFSFNKATGKKISITTSPTDKYPGQGGAFGLVNGIYSGKGLSYPDWLGWIGDDLEASIDLGSSQAIDSVRMHTINQNGSWIYLPQYIEIFGSADGKTFSSIGKSSSFITDTLTMGWMTVPVKNTSTRYIKLVAKNFGLIPDNLLGAGNKAWLFADEIQVY